MKIKWEDKRTMDDNPASVEMHSGNIILNKDVFPKYSKFTQQFIIEHEKGHYLLPTDSEETADFYALKKVYKTTGKSLKKTMKAITDFLPESNPRVLKIYKHCLELDAKDNGNKKAEKELENLKEDTQMKKMTGMYSPFLNQNAMGRRRADGGENEGGGNADVDDKNTNNVEVSNRKYIDVAGFQMTFFEIIISAVLLIFLVKKIIK
jgi:hypothetical protein